MGTETPTQLSYLDHVNIRTGQLATMKRFYTSVLGLEEGERPPFSFAGSWLYCGTRAVVHLVETEQTPTGFEPRIEHFAFRADGLSVFVAHLQDQNVPHRLSAVPGRALKQVHLADPDGNHIEVAFAGDQDI
jgi:catechol 2,3-dioxygenase-like lactoylglutathione lyase family enzyme